MSCRPSLLYKRLPVTTIHDFHALSCLFNIEDENVLCENYELLLQGSKFHSVRLSFEQFNYLVLGKEC